MFKHTRYDVDYHSRYRPMTDRLASLFESAVGIFAPMSEALSLDLFTEITNYDESACDAWIKPDPVWTPTG